ncbi:MAG: hypothetical protein ACK5Y2_12695 [Bdellovibrionales bacterium]
MEIRSVFHSIMVILFLFAAVGAHASPPIKRLEAVYACKITNAGGAPRPPAGAPRLSVKEYLVRATAPAAAFRHIFELEVRALNPSLPSKIYSLKRQRQVQTAKGPVDHYRAVNSLLKESDYVIKNVIEAEMFRIEVTETEIEYTCPRSQR